MKETVIFEDALKRIEELGKRKILCFEKNWNIMKIEKLADGKNTMISGWQFIMTLSYVTKTA